MKALLTLVFLFAVSGLAAAHAAAPGATTSSGDVTATPASPRPDSCAEPKREGKKAGEKKTPATGKSP